MGVKYFFYSYLTNYLTKSANLIPSYIINCIIKIEIVEHF